MSLFIKEDFEWILKRYASRIGEFKRNSLNSAAVQANIEECAEILAIISKIGYGDCYSIQDFIEIVADGGFIDYDGSGYWSDANGNRLGPIYCNKDWLIKNKPKDAKYVLWYNK